MPFNKEFSAQLSKWFYVQKPNPAATLRLFCFPYAGGGTSIFRDWYQFLPDECEVIAVRPPGRESRFSEKAISSLPVLVESLYQQILPLLNKPYVFFGHSNGALTCFELARLLQRHKMREPQQVILSAKCPPHIASETKNISHLSDAEFLAEIKIMNGTPLEILKNSELMELLMPTLRADFALSENLVYQNDLLLKAPLTVFYGEQDTITKTQIMAWQDLSLQPVNFTAFFGGHFFIDEQSNQLLNVLNQVMSVNAIA